MGKVCVAKPRLRGYDLRAKNLASKQLAIISNTHSNEPLFKPFNANEIIAITASRKLSVQNRENVLAKSRKSTASQTHDTTPLKPSHVKVETTVNSLTTFNEFPNAKEVMEVPKESVVIESESAINKSSAVLAGRHVRLPFSSKPAFSNKWQCKCGNDPRLSCCTRAAKWLNRAYKNNYQTDKYRKSYEVRKGVSVGHSAAEDARIPRDFERHTADQARP